MLQFYVGAGLAVICVVGIVAFEIHEHLKEVERREEEERRRERMALRTRREVAEEVVRHERGGEKFELRRRGGWKEREEREKRNRMDSREEEQQRYIIADSDPFRIDSELELDTPVSQHHPSLIAPRNQLISAPPPPRPSSPTSSNSSTSTEPFFIPSPPPSISHNPHAAASSHSTPILVSVPSSPITSKLDLELDNGWHFTSPTMSRSTSASSGSELWDSGLEQSAEWGKAREAVPASHTHGGVQLA